MAKMINCEFCGKEMKKGFLGITGDAETLTVGLLQSFTVCPECYEKYKDFVEQDNQRFGVKVDNMKVNHRKISKEERVKLFEQYYEESKDYNKPGTKLNQVFHYCVNTEKGFGTAIFHTKETSYVNTILDELLKNMEKDGVIEIKKTNLVEGLVDAVFGLDEEEVEIDTTPWTFTGEDVTRFEYFAGMYKTATTGFINKKAVLQIPVTLYVNDPHQMSYKPCAFQGLLVIPSGFTGNGKAFKQAMEGVLERMKADLGISNEIQAVCHKSSMLR
ncbi:MAG: hypothetical protein IKZ19_08470 [Clostridia bacterium]|nr:hypothetical protein [Clostridia bacterium]